MIKTNLPVILLKGIILLPNNDIRLEFDNDSNRSIIDVAELFHDNNILVVSQIDPLEEAPEINELPKFGVISKISHRIELPNGKIRIVISGLRRANVHEYLNLNKKAEVIESIVSNPEAEEIDADTEVVMIKKLYRELEDYIKKVPYMSNGILNTIKEINKLSVLTDVVAPNLPIGSNRIWEYLKEYSSIKRSEMVLEDIYKEKEMFDIEKEIDLKVRKDLENNQKDYILREKIKHIKQELGDISPKDDDVEKIRQKLSKINVPEAVLARLEQEIRRYESLPQASPEIGIARNYIDWLIELPWDKFTEDNNNLKEVKKYLDETHYGIDKVKTRIIEYLAIKQMTNSLRGPIICLVGPPGVGKTSLVFSIAKAINRNFVKMSVGGVHDEAEIKGHRRTYLGANPGRIIQSMKKAKSNNPVFLIDEIDKMTKDYKGDPASALLEVLDPEQNKFFSDNYIEEEYDLSQVMFITTANYVEDIPEALKDRLEIVELSGYTEFEKLDIAKRHLIKKICLEHGIEENKITFPDDAILEIIRFYTKEAGVRELERQLSSVIRKIVTSIIINKISIDKLDTTVSNIKKYLGKRKYHFNFNDTKYKIGVVNGLAYTNFGGDTLPIEVNYYKGNGELVLTGSLGNVMKESARIALSYIKANHKTFNINYDLLIHNDIHIHVPEGAIPKDGPSAGVTLTTALISAFTNLKIDKTVAMTGEITLRGNVLPIGGLKEKSIGASRNNIKTIFIPFNNQKDLEDVPKEIKDLIQYIPVRDYKEIFNYLKKVG